MSGDFVTGPSERFSDDTVERAAKALCEFETGTAFEAMWLKHRHVYLAQARTVLAAAFPVLVEEIERALRDKFDGKNTTACWATAADFVRDEFGADRG